MEPPRASDCCGSGCNPCIFDIYEQQLKAQRQPGGVSRADTQPTSNCISLTSYSLFRLLEVKNDSKDTCLYTFQYVPKGETDERRLFYEAGQHFLLRGQRECSLNTYFTRAYTPIHDKSVDRASFTVLIKLYKNGLMSDFIRKLKISDATFWRGPYGTYKINYHFRHVLMIAQGTGIAPIYTVINKLIENEDCETFIELLYACRDVDSIHLRNEIYGLCAYWNFKCQIFLSFGTEATVDKKYKENLLFRKLQFGDVENYFSRLNSSNLQVLICGSDSFTKQMLAYVEKCNIDQKYIHIF